MFSAPAQQVPGVQHAAVMAPRMDASLEVGTFPRLTTWPIITSDQHELFTKFLKLKPPVFKGCLAFLAHLRDDTSKVPSIESVSIVREFLDVFSADLCFDSL